MKLEEYLFGIHDLLDDVSNSQKVSVPSHGTRSDLDGVRTRYRTNEIYELEIWVMITRGPILLTQPTIGFHSSPQSDEPFHYARILDMYPEWQELRWVPIVNDGCGNYFVFALPESGYEPRPVYFVDVSESTVLPQFIAASSLYVFLMRFLKAQLIRDSDAFTADRIAREDADALSLEVRPTLIVGSNGTKH